MSQQTELPDCKQLNQQIHFGDFSFDCNFEKIVVHVNKTSQMMQDSLMITN